MKFKTTALTVTSFLAILLSGCNDNDAEKFIGDWSGEISASKYGDVISADINLHFEADDNNSGQLIMSRHADLLIEREGSSDRHSTYENDYSLVALSETEVGMPAQGGAAPKVMFEYNPDNDTITYYDFSLLIAGDYDATLTRD